MNYINKIGKLINKFSEKCFLLLLFSVKITTSVYPVPSICRFDQLGDWFESLAGILHWNLRESQSNLETDRNNEYDEPLQTQNEENIFEENQNDSTDSTVESSVDVHL